MSKEHTVTFSQVARMYEPDNRQQFGLLVESASNIVRDFQNNPDLVGFYAAITCGIAVGIRVHTGVDLCTLSFVPVVAPFPSSHPISKVLPILNHIIKSHLNWLADADSNDAAFADVVAKFHAALIWKGYLIAALNAEPSTWDVNALHAMNAFRILTTADPTEVIATNKRDAVDQGVRDAIQTGDWPPSGYTKLYFANRQLLVYKNKMLLGIDFPPSFR